MNNHFIEANLRSKLQSGEITEETVMDASRLAGSTSKFEHIALYSLINRAFQHATHDEQTEEDVEHAEEESN